MEGVIALGKLQLEYASEPVDVDDIPFLRCKCGKIVSQTSDDLIVIKCRHCKRYIIIHTKGIEKIEYK